MTGCPLPPLPQQCLYNRKLHSACCIVKCYPFSFDRLRLSAMPRRGVAQVGLPQSLPARHTEHREDSHEDRVRGLSNAMVGATSLPMADGHQVCRGIAKRLTTCDWPGLAACSMWHLPTPLLEDSVSTLSSTLWRLRGRLCATANERRATAPGWGAATNCWAGH